MTVAGGRHSGKQHLLGGVSERDVLSLGVELWRKIWPLKDIHCHKTPTEMNITTARWLDSRLLGRAIIKAESNDDHQVQ